MANSTPTWVAIGVAVIALAGVLVAQSITLYNERSRRRDEQTKVVRKDVHRVMMAFFDFAEFARATRPGRGNEDICDPYEDQWSEVAGPLAAGAANMAGRGKHRDAALALMDGIALQENAYREGEHIGRSPQIGYIQMAWAGFEVVAAWLRGERIPRHARGVTRNARRMRARLEAERDYRVLAEAGGHRTGVVRLASRKALRWGKEIFKKGIAVPVAKAWRFLFAP